MNTEIMVIRNDDGKDRLKIFAVDDLTLSKLIQIRGNLYRDNPKLRAMANMPKQTQEPQIDPERQAYLAGAYARYLAAQATSPATQQQPLRPLTPEEAWERDPKLRREFNFNIGAYLAYCKAAEAGRAKVYGRG